MLLEIEWSFIRVRPILEEDLHAPTGQWSEIMLKIKVFPEKNVEK